VDADMRPPVPMTRCHTEGQSLTQLVQPGQRGFVVGDGAPVVLPRTVVEDSATHSARPNQAWSDAIMLRRRSPFGSFVISLTWQVLLEKGLA
jgi:hypothetical protein